MAHDIFISYSRRDEAFVRMLCSYLEEGGLSYWIDEEGIALSEDYKERIGRAIYECKAFLFVWTEASNESAETAKEIAVAQEFGKKIIPLRIGTFQASFRLVYDLPRLHRIDADAGNLHPFLLELVDKLQRIKQLDERPAAPEVSCPEPRFVCVSGRDVTPEMILQATAIDAQVYSDCFRCDSEKCLAWWRRNPEIYVMVRDTAAGRVVGYVNAMPLCDELYDRIRSGDYIDVDIPPEAIHTYELPDLFRLYFASIAIDPQHRNSCVFKILFDAFWRHVGGLAEREVFFRELMADAVSESGVKMCRYLDLKPERETAHGSTIYAATLLPPRIRATTRITREVLKTYLDYYQEMR